MKLHERSYLTQQISVLEDGIRLLPRNWKLAIRKACFPIKLKEIKWIFLVFLPKMGVHRSDIPVTLKYLRQIFSDFFPTNDSYYWQATLLKRAAFFKSHDNPCRENCIEKRIASLLHAGQVHSRSNFASLLLSSFQTMFQLLQQQCDTWNKMNGCLASKFKFLFTSIFV